VNKIDVNVSAKPTIISREAIAQVPLVPLGPMEGVLHKILWRAGTSIAGTLTVEKGHRLGAHTHRVNHHHMWVLHGHATILGTVLGEGSYVHIPSGVEHDIDATTTEGCTVFYLYEQPGA
jgi:hypothetical protein